MLRGQGSGYPAELYAGTYTGRCYPCTNKRRYEENYSKVSGARVWSYPPNCPSHRRERETFFGFDDCTVCHGEGRTHVSRADGMGGSYYVSCQACMDRHHAHPVVASILHRSALNLFRSLVLRKRTEKAHDKRFPEDVRWDKENVQITFREHQAAHATWVCPDTWPALTAAEKRKVLREIPRGVSVEEAEAILAELGGNPRRRRKKDV